VKLALIELVSLSDRRHNRHPDAHKLGHQLHPILRHEPAVPHDVQSAVLQPMAADRQMDTGAASTDGQQRTHWDQSHGDPGHPGLASKKPTNPLLSGVEREGGGGEDWPTSRLPSFRKYRKGM